MVLRRHPHSSLLPYTTLFRSYLLDAVRLLRRSVYWRPQDEHAFEQWCESYLNWLLNGEQGRKLSRASSFHAIAYDLQVYSLAAYLGDIDVMRSEERRVGKDGSCRWGGCD